MTKPVKILLLFVTMLMLGHVADAQCAMCSAIADEASQNGSTAANGINKGVLYLFLSPYLIVATIGFIWWRSRRKAQAMLNMPQS
jgi:hypothetical protein